MKHLGDITKIDGSKAPVVDCVIGGSPCQDLSVAGKRAGLEGERSGLFMEQIRIIKEMRENDKRVRGVAAPEFVRPRYMVWENVPGAFSSNKGEDFRVVLEETARVCQKDAVIPMPKDGKWRTSGCIVGNGWSIAWRVFDAQFWGVPQRRRRIALVADFGGESAAEILFVRKGVSGNSEKSREERKTVASNVKSCSGADDREGAIPYTLKIRSGVETDSNGKTAGKGALIQENLSATLGVSQDQYLFQPVGIENHPADSRVDIDESGKVQTLTSRMGTGGGNVPLVLTKSAFAVEPGIAAREGGHFYEDVSGTIRANAGDNQMAVVYAVDQGGGKSGANFSKDQAPTLCTTHGGEPAVVYQDKVGALCTSDYKGVGSQYVAEDKLVCQVIAPTVTYWDGSQTVGTLTANNAGGNQRMPDKENFNCVIVSSPHYIVRRLTPTECERLQGFPDGWTDIGDWTDSKGKTKSSSDAARYKALGNSIALPSWKWVLKKLCACYERDATMASLFDGIGGFPYLWEMINGKGSCLWASEIEEFPIAVTKKRIGE